MPPRTIRAFTAVAAVVIMWGRRLACHRTAFFAAALCVSSPALAASQESAGKPFAFELSATSPGATLTFPGRTSPDLAWDIGLEGMASDSPAAVRRSSGHVIATQQLNDDTTVTATYRVRDYGLRLELDVHSSKDPWTTPVLLKLQVPDPASLRIWTARGGPKEWSDPLQPRVLATETINYGAWFKSPDNGFALPMLTLFPKDSPALSIVASPDQPLLEMKLRTTSTGTIELRQKFRRFGDNRHAVFAFDIVRHEPDVRAALAWMTKNYSDYFEAPNPKSHKIAGGGAYSGYEGELDAKKLHQMSYRVNWKASLDFPYMGMFLPPVPPRETYNRFAGGGTGAYTAADEGRFGQTSIHALEQYNRRMRKLGFHVLSYFNVTEFGGNIADAAPPTSATTAAKLWKDPNGFLYRSFPNAILRAPGVLKTWGGAVAMDCGDPAYADFLLEQAKRHIRELPSSDGICIDRMDWLTKRNPRADDGITWDGGPQRSVHISWRDFMKRLAPLMHNANKVIIVNPHVRRIETVRHVDGIYDEFGHDPWNLNTATFLALRKPLICWTPDDKAMKADPNAFFQRHLYMGAFMTIPVPGNDHTILPSEWADRQYLDYGPLFNELRGRKWILETGAVSVTGDQAKANLFEVPGGWAAPVTFATAPLVELVLRNLPGGVTAKVRHPGEADWKTVDLRRSGKETRIQVPTERGCAMIRLIP